MDVKELELLRRKHFLRGWYRQAVARRPASARAREARRAVARLTALPAFREAQTVGLYCALPGELDTSSLFAFCRRVRKTAAVPVVIPESRDMAFSLVRDGARWTRDAHGIPVPARGSLCLIDPGHIELLVVPGRAFTPWGGRLGMGGGYYDRFLARFPLLPAYGLAFDEQVARRLPLAPHDAAVDGVVTPGGVYHAR